MTTPNSNYEAYGTVFSSPVPIPGFSQTDAPPAVAITFGEVPDQLNEATTNGPFWTGNSLEMLLVAPKVGRYLVSNGNSIVVDAPSLTSRLLTILVGIPVGSVLMQRGLLVMHAAAVDDPMLGTIAICGENGAGKSSLVTAMTESGGTRICDNLGAVTTDSNGDHLLLQGPNSFRLWSHSAQDFNFDPKNGQRVSDDQDKYMFEDSAAVPESGSTRLNAIICLHTDFEADARNAGPHLSRMDVASATAFVAENHFRNELARVMVPNWFDRMSALAASVPVYRLVRPETSCPPRELAAFLCQELAPAIHK